MALHAVSVFLWRYLSSLGREKEKGRKKGRIKGRKRKATIFGEDVVTWSEMKINGRSRSIYITAEEGLRLSLERKYCFWGGALFGFSFILSPGFFSSALISTPFVVTHLWLCDNR